jgi:uncharacterized protein (TIGR02594 family)
MHFKTRMMFAASCVALLALSIPAFSLPAPHGAAKHHALTDRAKARTARENRTGRLVSMPISETPKRPLFGWPALVSEARKYLGTNPTARQKLWCATFMNLVLAKVGYSGTNSDAAKSFAEYGRRVSEPEIGAIAVLTRGRTGGHVGVVSGIDGQGNPIIISGNHGHRVGEASYPRSRVIAYVMPSGDQSVTTQIAARSHPSQPNQPSRTSSGPGLESPIAELLAAIEAEQNRPVRPSQQAAQQRPAEPHRAVQQLPEQTPQAALASRRALPLDPALANLLGISSRVQDRVQAAPPPPRVAPQRQRQVQQQQPSRVVVAGIRP